MMNGFGTHGWGMIWWWIVGIVLLIIVISLIINTMGKKHNTPSQSPKSSIKN